MNAREYEQWETDLVSAFPELGAWLASQSSDTREKWRNVLSDVRLDSALAATRELLAGDLPPPAGPSKYPATLRKRARELACDAQRKVQYYDRQRAYSCQACADSGVVTILHPHVVKQLLRGVAWSEVKSVTGRKPGITTTSACCTCPLGQQQKSIFESHPNKPELSVFDPNKHFRVEASPCWREPPTGLDVWLDKQPSTQAELSF